jgi:hypothetical protein
MSSKIVDIVIEAYNKLISNTKKSKLKISNELYAQICNHSSKIQKIDDIFVGERQFDRNEFIKSKYMRIEIKRNIGDVIFLEKKARYRFKVTDYESYCEICSILPKLVEICTYPTRFDLNEVS